MQLVSIIYQQTTGWGWQSVTWVGLTLTYPTNQQFLQNFHPPKADSGMSKFKVNPGQVNKDQPHPAESAMPSTSEISSGNMKYSWSIQYLLTGVRPEDGISINHYILFLYNAIRLIVQMITISLIIYAFACCGRDCLQNCKKVS